VWFANDKSSYDYVIIDLLDPRTEPEIAWLLKLTRNAFARLKVGGDLCVQVGGTLLLFELN
jgi:predicted membrane-bound spermidine synthase